MRHCHATRPKDKEAILHYSQGQPGGIDKLNDAVRMVAQSAMKRAELMAAAVAGDAAYLKQADATELQTWRSIRGRNAIHVAAAHSRVAAIVEILTHSNGSQLNLPDDDGCTPLSVAAESGALAGTEALICLRANIETPSHSGMTPLMLATAGGVPMVVVALLEAKADASSTGKYKGFDGHQAITIASFLGNTEIVLELLRRNAQAKSSTVDGASALHLAASMGHAEVVSTLLLARAAVNGCTKVGWTALTRASQNGHASVVALLLAARADVFIQGENGRCAVDYCSTECGGLTRSITDEHASGQIQALLESAASSRRQSLEIIATLRKEEEEFFDCDSGSESRPLDDTADQD
eukprot:gnl/TRDRNA2_/TRDRNA2_68075_c0_seq1.p1 gnl/TRDRNA2_/TRDRNA2_68075_c0~~gnl/TRDRNA2_/TRDRNA2_68075_c0_seq1.p1  ORF type:complete len:353 (+),score=61.72 gnl/TRDRNA2_/TRDRNA2_68075_c0_seq1:103-1161(+)